MKNKLLAFLVITGLTNIALVIGEILNTDPRNTGMFMAILITKCFIDIVPLFVLKD